MVDLGVIWQNMASKRFQDLDVYRLAEKLSEEIWNIIQDWKPLAQDTVGKQIIRSADSIGANIAEGSGRESFQDNKRFVKMARGSLYETQHWLRRAYFICPLSDVPMTSDQ